MMPTAFDSNYDHSDEYIDTTILDLMNQQRANEALSLLIKEYAPRVRAVIKKKRGRSDFRLDLDEVLFESITRFWKKFALFSQTKSAILPWLTRIADNVACDHIRRLAKLPLPRPYPMAVESEQSHHSTVEKVSVSQTWGCALHKAIKSDPNPLHRKILQTELRLGRKLPAAELARRLGKTPGCIRVYRERALKRLRKILPEIDPFFKKLGENHD